MKRLNPYARGLVVGSVEFAADQARIERIKQHLRRLGFASRSARDLDELMDIAFRLFFERDYCTATLAQLRADRAAGMPATARFSEYSAVQLDAVEHVLAWLVE